MRLPESVKRAFRATPFHPPYVRTVLRARAVRAGLRQRWRSVVRVLSGEPPLPDAHLMTLVAGNADAEWFLRSGRMGAESIAEVLARNGVAVADMKAVLDFGCGVGRVLRHWKGVRGPRFHGTDYNALLVDWCRRHLRFARLNVNTLRGGLPYADGTFDFAYALSVFTHLTIEQQLAWMAELRRVIRPGGHLLISTHGDRYKDRFSPAQLADYDAGRTVVVDGQVEGTNVCAAYHPPGAVRGPFSAGYEVVDFVPEGARGNPWQDYWLLRRP